MRFIAIAIAISMVLILARGATEVRAATLPVTTLEDTVAADGECSIREALDNALDNAATHADCPAGAGNDEITLPAGSIDLTGGELHLDSGALEISGQGIDLTTINAGDASRALFIDAAGTFVFRDFAITGGNSTEGGGILLEAGELTLERVRLHDNHASNLGGALFSQGPPAAPALSIVDSEFVGNSSQGAGGAIAFDSEGGNGLVSILDSTFNLNHAGGHGGAVWMRDGTLDVGDSHFADNTGSYAGALALNNVQATLDGSHLFGNSATNDGGALSAARGSLEVTSTNFAANGAGAFGGAMDLADAIEVTLIDVDLRVNEAVDGGAIAARVGPELPSLRIESSTFFDNDASGHGAGIFFEAGTLEVADSIISLNRAELGGSGIWAWIPDGLVADLTVRDTLFYTNVSSKPGGAIFFEGTAGIGTLAVESSSFWNNNAQTGLSLQGVTATITNSTLTSSAGTTIRAVNPQAEVLIINSTIVGDFPGFVDSTVLLHAMHDANVTVHNSILVLARDTACVEENQGVIQGANNANDDGSCPGAMDIDAYETLFPPQKLQPSSRIAHFPIPGSAVINAGNPMFCPAVDQRGFERSDGSCDIGAIEFYFRLVAAGATNDGP